MSSPIGDDDLRDLGLAGHVRRAEAWLPGPSGAVGHGRAATMEGLTAERLRELVGSPSFPLGQVALPLLKEAGLGLERGSESPTILRAWSLNGEVLDACSPDSDDACWPDPDDEAAWYADLAVGERVAFVLPSAVVVLKVVGQSVAVATFTAPPPTRAPIAPVLSWLADCDDAWLVARVNERRPETSAWQAFVAAGDLVRLRADLGKHRKAIVTGDPSAGPMRPRAWVRGLGSDELASLEGLAAAAVEMLHDALATLIEDVAPLEEAWLRRLGDLLTQRDEIEGGRILLLDAAIVRAASGAQGASEPMLGTRLDAGLDVLDENLSELLRTLPRGLKIEDERLQRIARRDAGAWWAALSGG